MKGGRARTAIAVATVAAASAAWVASPLTRSARAADPCAAPVSVIACENTNPGTPPSQWQVSGDGDSTIQGFATAMSVNAGETVTFKVKTPASAYHLDILRMGWYQGNGARRLTTIRPTATLPQSQPACRADATTGLIDCGTWAVSASWAVPSSAVSGVYLARLVRDDTGGASLIPFVVRNDASHSDLLVQTSDETWEAYNTYGGNSLYQCSVSCPPGNPAGYKGAYAVSYNRPFHSAEDDQGRSWVMYAEYPMIRFLEANGYDVSYTSASDVARRGPLLTNHKVFVSVGHDEYWSADQRTNVEAARDAGVHLAFFSGNEVFWKTRWAASSDGSSTPYRTVVTYKETHFDAPADPQDPPTWTGTWRDPRFSPPADGRQAENSLTGQYFLVNSGTTDIRVPAQYARLRFWRNTAVANLSSGQTITLGSGIGTLGYEWDEDADNGFRPPGTMALSSTTVNVPEAFNDYGTFVEARTVTHRLTLYRAGSGALVFGAGTVQWAWGLDAANGPKLPADRNMQQATVNLFADMGAQPYALLSGLVAGTASSDTTPPSSSITLPATGATVADGTRVTVSGTATDAGGGIVAGVEVSTDGGTTWHPATGTSSWSYSWVAHGNPTTTIRTRAVDDSGNIETPATGRSVGVSCPCSIFGTSMTPTFVDSGDANAVEVGVKFTADVAGTVSGIRFYKSSGNTGTHVGNLWSASGALLARVTFANETATGWQQASLSPPVTVSPGTTYVASYFAPRGHYSQDEGYMFLNPSPAPDGAASLDAPPLHALRNSGGVANGVYSYTAATAFPTSTYNGENYWVDVVFTPTPATPPGTPSNVVATAGNASASVAWAAPTSGGAATSYVVTPFVGTTARTPTTVTGTPPPTSTVVGGLTNGTTYTFTVTASNAYGDGPPSDASNAVTPSATSAIVSNGGFESGLAGWTASGVAPPTPTTVRAHTGSGAALLGTTSGTEPLGESTLTQRISVPSGSPTLTFWYWPTTTDGLCAGSNCQWDWEEAQIRSPSGAVLAGIFKGNSNAQAWTQVTFDLTPYAGTDVVLWFNVHQDGANPPDDTAIYLDDVTVAGGVGSPTAPAAPTNVVATAGDRSATVTWTAPANGGSGITAYTVTPHVGATALAPTTVTGAPPPASAVVTGLTNGTTYTFTVSATNGVGAGPESAASNPVTPAVAVVPAFVQQTSAHAAGQTSVSVTPAAAVTAGHRMVVLVGTWSSGGATASSVTDSAGNTYVRLLAFKASDKTQMSVWTAPITAGGATRPTITARASATADIGVAAVEYSGLSTVADATVVDTSKTASGKTGANAATVSSGPTAATVTGNELALGFYVDSGFGNTLSFGAGWNGRVNVAPTSDMELVVEDQIAAAGATPSASVRTGARTTWLMATIVLEHG